MLTISKFKPVDHENRKVDFDNNYDIALKILQVKSLEVNQSLSTIRATLKSNVRDLMYIDPRNLLMMDVTCEEQMFVDENEIYSRDELYNKYPFRELNTLPETVFRRQQLHVFEVEGSDVPDVLASDLEGNEEICTARDELGMEKTAGYVQQDIERKRISTKIYIGKTELEDFKHIGRTVRGAMKISGNTKFLTDIVTGGNTSLMIESSVVQVAEDIKNTEKTVENLEDKVLNLTKRMDRVQVADSEKSVENLEDKVLYLTKRMDRVEELLTEVLGKIDNIPHWLTD